MINYSQYRNGTHTHAEFYGQFVTDRIKNILLDHISKKRLLVSDREAFNDIPLKEWDALPLPAGTRKKVKDAGEFWAPSVPVCIFKQAARQIVNDHYRAEFWSQHPQLKAEHFEAGKDQNDYNATIRTIFVDWIDSQNRAGKMSEAIAQEITLG